MKLLVSALEPSSNKYLKDILKHLIDVDIVGIGDKSVVLNSMYSLENFSVMGLSDVLPKIFFFKKAIFKMASLAHDCDGVLLLDAPSFNLRVAKQIKEKFPNKPIFYYILPKIWAWKSNRGSLVHKYTDYQISILPFENRFYPNAFYFGNPLLDEYSQSCNNFTQNEYVAFLAGSRKSEILSLMPVFRQVAKKIISTSNKKPILVIPDTFSLDYVSLLYGDISDFKIMSNTKDAFEMSSFAFVCSGTATFEASLSGVAFILCYAPKGLDLLTYYVFFKILNNKGIGKIGYVGLANIISYFANKDKIHDEVLPFVSIDILWDKYINFDYDKYHVNIQSLKDILNQSEEVDSLKQVADLISENIVNS